VDLALGPLGNLPPRLFKVNVALSLHRRVSLTEKPVALSNWPCAEDYMCAHGRKFQFSYRVLRTLAYTYALKRMTVLWFNSASEERSQVRILPGLLYENTRLKAT
jgi:hypothetical protein